jgi:hypothetical protein
MPDLDFQVEKAEPLPHAAAPTLVLKVRITQGGVAVPIHSVVLRCQVRIEPARRRYVPTEQERLLDLFGEPARWGQTLRSMLWTHVTTAVSPFTAETVLDLQVPCTHDFNVAAAKYFYALEDGVVPLGLLFSGTVFYAGPGGALQVGMVPWEKEASFGLPVSAWKDMMDLYYPNSAWLCLRRDVFDRLYAYKRRRGLATWEQALEGLLPPEGKQGEGP